MLKYKKTESVNLYDFHQMTEEYLIHPWSKSFGYWNLFQLFSGYIYLVLFPVHIGFYDHNNFSEIKNTYYGFEIFVSITFFIDIIVTFRTVIMKSNKFISDINIINYEYLRSWFFIDLLSVVPFDIACSPENNFSVWYKNIYRFCLIFKLCHIYKVSINWSKSALKKTIQFDSSLIWRIARYLIIQLYIIHLFVCILLFVASQEEYRGLTSWRSNVRVTSSSSMSEHYTLGFYILVVTITSTGYGDVVPITIIERWIFIFIIISASYGLAYLFANMASIFTSHDFMRTQFENYKNSVEFFLKNHNLDKDIVDRVSNYLTYCFEHTQVFPLHSGDEEILSSLSRPMKKFIQFELHRRIIEKVSILQGKPEEFIQKFLNLLKTELYAPGDLIAVQGETGNTLYFINSGIVDVYFTDTDREESSIRHLGELSVGAMMGEISVLFTIRRTATLIARTYVDVYSLDRDNLVRLLKMYPGTEESFKSWAIQSKYTGTRDIMKAWKLFPNLLPKIVKIANRVRLNARKRKNNLIRVLRGSLMSPDQLIIRK